MIPFNFLLAPLFVDFMAPEAVWAWLDVIVWVFLRRLGSGHKHSRPGRAWFIDMSAPRSGPWRWPFLQSSEHPYHIDGRVVQHGGCRRRRMWRSRSRDELFPTCLLFHLVVLAALAGHHERFPGTALLSFRRTSRCTLLFCPFP